MKSQGIFLLHLLLFTFILCTYTCKLHFISLFLKTSFQLRRFQLFITYILTGSVSRQEVFYEKCVLKISEMFTSLGKFHILQWLYAKVVLKKDKVLVKGDPKSMNQRGYLLAICDPSCCIQEPESKQFIGF